MESGASRFFHVPGTSHGTSTRIAEGVYYRPGVHAGKIAETTEEWRMLDSGGSMVVSDRLVVYSGTRTSREFPFAKLTGHPVFAGA